MSLPFDVEWLRPGAAWWLALAAAVWLAGAWAGAARRRALERLADAALVPRLFPERRRGDGRWLATAATALLVLAAMGPVRGYTLEPVRRRGVDVVLVVDTSRSMLAQDVDPDRLTRAKREIGALLDRLEGERVGLIAFAGDARDVAPLTRDVETIRWFTDRLSPEENRAGGTDLGAALRASLARFDGRDGAHEAIVLVTDGEDLTGEGLGAAEEAAARGIRVHVLGMGTTDGAKIPDGAGGFVRDVDGSEVVSRLEDETLRAIAGATDGVYLRAHGSVLPLERLYERGIAGMEGREIVEGKERIPQDRYQWMLVLALGCMTLEAGRRARRARPRDGTRPRLDAGDEERRMSA